jgi:putative transposase
MRLLQSDRSAQLFVEVVYEYRAQGKYRLHEFVVMPDHFHLLLTVDSSSTIERAVQFIKGGFAFRAGRELGMRAPIWQKGFSEIRVSDATAYARQRDYIRQNPVAAHMANVPEEYSYSSAYPGFELDPLPQRLKPAALVGACGMAEAIP